MKIILSKLACECIMWPSQLSHGLQERPGTCRPGFIPGAPSTPCQGEGQWQEESEKRVPGRHFTDVPVSRAPRGVNWAGGTSGSQGQRDHQQGEEKATPGFGSAFVCDAWLSPGGLLNDAETRQITWKMLEHSESPCTQWESCSPLHLPHRVVGRIQ